MSFQSELKTKRLMSGRRELLDDLVWDDGILRIVVPKGFRTDFSSVPRLALGIMPRWDQTDLAGVVHDYLYKIQYPRQLADAIWRFIQSRNGRAQAWLGWLGLRVGGWWAYRKHGKAVAE